MKNTGMQGARYTYGTPSDIHIRLSAIPTGQKTWKVGLLFGAFLAALAILLFLSPHARAQGTGTCPAPPEANEIVVENCKPGDPASEWDVQGSGDPSIQGFATDMSVDQGETVQFKVKTDATDYRLDIYRMGYYDGNGARKVATVQPSATLSQDQPNCLDEQSTGLIDCGNWDVSASWDMPNDAVSGVYFARLVRESGPSGASHIVFVVRDDDGESNMLFQTADTTWQAYNSYGGNSLYTGSPAGRAYKVSYNRPFNTRAGTDEDWLFNSEYPMIRWLERNGYDVSYFTGIDSDRYGDEILDHETFLSVGHDEYWSGDQRENVEAARDAGVNLAFFSGNEVFWKTRWEDSIDGSGASHRTLVSYKETRANAKIDPSSEWTGTWRDNRSFNPEGSQPENALTGTIFTVNCCTYPMKVPAEDGKMRLWRNTSVANLAPGGTATFPDGTLGYEWDEDLDNGFRPDGLIRLSSTTVDVPERIQDQGSTYAQGRATHALTLYRDANGAGPDALVFGAGTVQWPWGLDDVHDRSGGAPDARMQQATVNLFADMGVQPETLETGSIATASTDTTAPTSTITSPADGGTLEEDEPVTITGTASDGETGGVVGGVEVSVDGGQTWHRAEGREDWRYTWTPEEQGQVTIKSRAADDSVNLESPSAGRTVTVGPRAPASCPCTIWDGTTTPGVASSSDTNAVELGVKFHSDADGFITGLRFYKGAQNTGTHVGHLWTSGGQQLAEATFTAETASGWQEVTFDSPVAIAANTTYIASYHTAVGRYAFDAGYFANTGVDNPPLRALRNGVDGANGVYKYGPSGSFPADTFNSSNYWVDVVFEASADPDTTSPTVQSVSPGNGQGGVNTNTAVSATFNEAMDSNTMSSGTFELRDDASSVVPATVGYNPGTRTATLAPNTPLDNSKTYTATVKGGSDGVKDTAGNELVEDRTWSFTTAAPPPPPPDEGPGGPIAVIGSTENPFGRYYAEILRNEGLNAFTATDISSVSASTLGQYDTVILGDMPLTDAQAAMFTDWVNGGGNLISMSPDPRLAGLLGLTNASGTLSDAYLKVDTSSAPGKGIVGESMQFHGTADRYTLSGADAVATLYSNATTATSNPAVTMRDVGANGGQAAAFTYDLAKSVVYTRQGNPAWAGDERDGQSGPLRSDDLFYGAKAGDVQPDWVDLNKVAIPQADEQQRLLANLIGQMNLDKKPLPRFWYFPRGEEAVVVMTGDDHAVGLTDEYFDYFKQESPQNCSVADWECIRGTSYIYTNTPLTDTQAEAYENEGFEVALHVDTGCNNWTPQSLATNYTTQLAAWQAKYASLNAPATNRTHCIAWSDWASQPEVELQNGIRLDTNYYYWPGSWVQDRPGLFTGSGMPMRFAEEDGKMIDVYQANTQLTDESDQNLPVHIKALVDKALGPEGYYGAFTANMHTDRGDNLTSNNYVRAIVNEAKLRGVPVVSARQMLEWLDGRNASSFENMSWNDNKLNFSVDVGAGANGLQAMVPADSDDGKLTGLERGGNPVSFTKKTIKGVEYATFSAAAGAYEATYEADTTAPAVSGLTATPDADGTATITWTTDEPATSRVDYGTSAGTLNLNATEPGLTTSHSVRLTGLQANTTYHYRVTSADVDDNAATSPENADAPASFLMPDAGLTDTTAADFGGGTPGSGTYVSQSADGEVTLKPAVGGEFSGNSLPAGWTGTVWNPGGAATVSGGNLTVDGARAGTDALYGPGRSLEFVGTFGAATFQHVGFGTDFNDAPWANFSTGGGNLPIGLFAKSWAPGGTQNNTPITGIDPNQPHRYRIDWNASNIVYYVDGTEVARHQIAIGAQMRPLASDFSTGGPVITLDWLRMGPYQSSGAFESRVFDSETGATNWLDLTSTVQKPSGTNVAFETRSGNSATPDGTWSAWEAVPSGGTIASPDGRFLQYRANLSTNDQSVSPTVEQVTLTYGEGAPDNSAPIISALNAAPTANETATITWNTNESSTSRVDYGTSPGALTQSASDPTLTSSHSVGLTGLEAGTTYYYRVSSTDGAGNPATSPAEGLNPSSFETPDAGFTDTTTANFSAGTPGAATYFAQGLDGEVILKPTLGAEFSGSVLPDGWSRTQTWNTGGTSTVANGQLAADAVQIQTNDSYGPVRTLEFAATFGAREFQAVGFATDLSDFNGNSWAQFGTANSTNSLKARTNSNNAQVNDNFVIPNSGALIGSKHIYRIEWSTNEVRYFVDGNLVHTEPIAVGAQMRPTVSDFNSGGPDLSVDWMRMGPYASSGAFESRVFDSTKNATDWSDLTSASQKPTGTNVTFETRSGNASTPDGTWSGWQAVGTNDTIASPDNRYIQYRANLSTNDQSVSPTVEQVTLSYRLDKAPPAAPPKPDLATASDSGSSGSDDVTRDTTPTFNGTAEANSSVELFADGNTLGTADADANGAWSFTPTEALTDGTYQVTAKATDAAGNPSPTSTALSLKVDTAAPDTSITSGPQGTTSSTSAEFAFSSADQGATFECKLDNAGYEPCESPKSYTGLGDGQRSFSVRAVDVAGNTDASPAERNFTVDNTAPEAPSRPDLTTDSGSDNTDDLTNDATPTFTGTAENDATIRILVDGVEEGNAIATSGTYSITTNALDDGPHSVTAQARDTTGNDGTESEALDIIVDTQKPAAPTRVDLIAASDKGSSDTDNVTNDNTPTFDVTAEADSTVRIFEGSETMPLGSARAGSTGIATITSEQLTDGTYTVSATTEDAAGNVSDSSATINITVGVKVDTQPPDAPSRPDLEAGSDSGTSNSDNITNSTTPTFTGTAEADSTVKIFVDGVEEGSDTATSGSYSIATDELAPGTHSVTAEATDTVGNVGARSGALSIEVDVVAPDTTITAGPTGLVRQTSATLEFSSEQEATFECKIDGGSFEGCTSPKVYSGLAEGQHTFSARAMDVAGNTDQTPASRNWAVDTSAPSAPAITTPANNSYDTDGNVTVSGTAEANGTVELFDGTISKGTTQAGTGGNWSIDLTSVSNGEHTYTARTTDGAGNVSSSSAGTTVTVDAVAPTVSEVTPAANASNVAPGINIEATFSEAMNASTLTRTTFTLTADGASSPVGATVTYDGATRKATLNPDVDLAPDTRYTAVVESETRDVAGNPLAADRTWSFTTAQQNTQLPDTSITAGPSGVVASKGATFAFQSTKQGSTFQCSLDGARFANCASPKTYSNLSQGSHEFRVRARDAAGNVDATPAQRTWTVDTLAPTITNVSPAPNSTTTNRRPTIRATVKDTQTNLAKANIELSIDNVRITDFDYNQDTDLLTYTPPSNLSVAKHAVGITARDQVNNAGTKGWNFKIIR